MGQLIPVFKNIKAFVFDIDGVLTDGQVLVTEEGHMLRAVNIKDGFALQHAVKSGYWVGIISGGTSEGMRLRFEGLGVQHIYLGQSEKLTALTDFLQKTGLKKEEIAYMGDDLPDIPVFHEVGLSCCPKDASADALQSAQFISNVSGGRGCARDLIERTMKIQETWHNDETHTW